MNEINVSLSNNVISKKTINVVIAKNTSGVISTNRNVVTLKSVPTINEGIDRLDDLVDVDPSGETDGAVPVYNQSTDKYVVQKLDLASVNGDLDGGNF